MVRAVWKYILVGIVFVASLCGVIVLSIQQTSEDSIKVDAPVRTAQTQTPENKDEDIVYRTPSGSKYHLSASCSSLANSKTVEQTTIALALEDGLSACSRCAK